MDGRLTGLRRLMVIHSGVEPGVLWYRNTEDMKDSGTLKDWVWTALIKRFLSDDLRLLERFMGLDQISNIRRDLVLRLIPHLTGNQ